MAMPLTATDLALGRGDPAASMSDAMTGISAPELL